MAGVNAAADNPNATPAELHDVITNAATVGKLQTDAVREGTPNR